MEKKMTVARALDVAREYVSKDFTAVWCEVHPAGEDHRIALRDCRVVYALGLLGVEEYDARAYIDKVRFGSFPALVRGYLKERGSK